MVVAVLAAGCTHPRTELVIGLMTDLSATDMIDTVTLVADRNGVPLFQQTWPISGVVNKPEELPGSFGVYSSDGSEPLITLTATAYANQGTQAVVIRQSITSLVHEETLFLRMALVGGCGPMTCPSGATCIEGFCRPQAIDSHRFPVYRVNMEKSLACDSGPKYRNTSSKQLMPIVGDCGSDEDCIEGTCYKHAGGGGGGGADMGSTCDPVAQSGCPAGQKCYVSASGSFVCKAAGTKMLGQACTSGLGDDCAAGLHCAADGTPAICRQYCNHDSDCQQAAAMSGTEAEPTNVPRCFEGLSSSNVKLCSVSCDPVLANNDSGCPTGRACGFFTSATNPVEYTDCYVSKGIGDGQPCANLTDCVAGDTCAESGGGTPRCRPTCRPDQPSDCAAPSQCPSLPTPSNPIFSACCPAAGC
jgi:hypothetical protein